MMFRFPLLACSLSVLLLAGSVSAQEQKPPRIPFPLPTREMRVMEEARDPATPISQLVALVTPQSTQLSRAALSALGERGDASVLPALEKVQVLAPLDGSLANAIRQIRERAGLEKVVAPKIDVEAEMAYLQAHPVSEQDYRIGDDQKFRDYAGTLARLADTADKRILPFIEKYFTALRSAHLATDNPVNQDLEIDRLNDVLARAYWKLKLQGATLAQTVAAFRSAGSLLDNTPALFYSIEDFLVESGSANFPSMADIVRDKTASLALREKAARILVALHDPRTSDLLLAIANDPASSQDLKARMTELLASSAPPPSLEATLQTLAQGQGLEGVDNWEQITPALWRVETLAKAGEDKRVLEEAILPYLRSGSSTAVMVAREVGSEQSIEPLINIVKEPKAPTQDSREMVKCSAITTLGFIGQRFNDKDNKLLMFLIALSYDKDPLTRISAVQALARAGKQLVIPVLLDLAKSEKDSSALSFEVSGIYLAGGADAVEALREINQLAQANQNPAIVELTEEGLMRLEKEGRTGLQDKLQQ